MNDQTQTLQQCFRAYYQQHNLDFFELSQKTGLSVSTLRGISNGRSVSSLTIKTLAEKLDGQFEQFISYTKCVICGKLFMKENGNVQTCSDACAKIKNKQRQEAWHENKKNKPKEKEKQKATAFEALARSENMTYGERQKQERLRAVCINRAFQ